MCRNLEQVQTFGKAKLGDPTAGMTDAEQAAYWHASRDRMAAQAMEMERERDQLREYAHKATCVITELAGGGSELFAGKIGDMYLADLPFCKERVRNREANSHKMLMEAVREKRALLLSRSDI